jgi:hypothetical protein
VVGERERWKEAEMSRAGQTFPSRLAELREELEQSLAAAKTEHAEALSRVTEERDRCSVETRDKYQRRRADLRAEHDRDWQVLAESWHGGLAEIRNTFTAMETECERLFPDWNDTDYDAWPHPTEPTPAIRFGQVTLDLAQIKNGMPQDERLRPEESTIALPGLMALEEHPVLLATAEEEGRREAIDLLQLVMLRMLMNTTRKPAKLPSHSRYWS